MNSRIANVLVLLLVVASFLGGVFFTKAKQTPSSKNSQETTENKVVAGSVINFNVTKSEKPRIDFFVMSYCPYGNQAEQGLKPVADLLKDKVVWQPRYIVSDAKSSCEANCPYKVYNEEQCKSLVENKRVPDMDTCKQYLKYSSAQECLKQECADLKEGEFTSLHGEIELKEDVREICAWNMADDKLKWWQMVDDLNKNCTLENIETCWQQWFEKSGFKKAEIEACLAGQEQELLKSEIGAGEKMGGVGGSPTIFINGVLYPPNEIFEQQGSSLLLGDKTFTAANHRSAEAFKSAICAAFEKPPDECKQELSSQGSTSAAGGCN